jgi:flagellar protein FliJ
VTKSLATLIKLQKTRVDEQRLLLAKLQEQVEAIEKAILVLKEDQEQQRVLLEREPSAGLTYGDYLDESLKKKKALEKRKTAAVMAVNLTRDRLAEVFEEQKRYELAEKNRIEEEEREEQRQETHTLDEVGSVSFIRGKKGRR